MLKIDIVITEPAWSKSITNNIEMIAQKAFSCGRFAMPNLLDKQTILLGIECSNDIHIQKLNNKYRGLDKATNVLSFPQLEVDTTLTPDIPVILGDIILALETMQREAEEQKKELMVHANHLVIHGVLHLLGFDHINNDDAKKMEKLESDIMLKLGYDSPYC